MNENLIEVPRVEGNKFLLSVRSVLWPHKLYEKAHKEIGEAFAVPFGRKERYLFSNPVIVEEIFKTSPNILKAGLANSFFIPFLGKNSLLVLDGEKHLRERRLLMPSLLGERMAVYNPTIEKINITKLNSFLTNSNKLNLKDLFTETTLEVILKTVFGAPDGKLFDDLRSALLELRGNSNQVGSLAIFFPALQRDLGPLTPYRKFKLLQKRIDDLIFELIETKKNSPKGEDILSIILSEHYEDGSQAEMQTIRDQLLTLLLAGQDTTTHSLLWFFRWILIYPDKYKRLVEEIRSFESAQVGATSSYLDCVIKEALRIYPVFLMVGRVASEDLVLGGKYKIKKGSFVSPFIFGVHHREDLFPNSNEFIPERFENKRFTPFEYFPFGGGGRRCIGAPFALNQMKITIATLMYNFDFSPLFKGKPEPLRQGVGFVPKGKIEVLIQKR